MIPSDPYLHDDGATHRTPGPSRAPRPPRNRHTLGSNAALVGRAVRNGLLAVVLIFIVLKLIGELP